MAKVVNLSVHINTRDKRRRRRGWEFLRSDVNKQRNDVDGYALVTWNTKGAWDTSFYVGSNVVGLNNMPEYVKIALLRSIEKYH